MATTTSSMAHACDRARNWVAERTSTHGALDALRSGGWGGRLVQPKRNLGRHASVRTHRTVRTHHAEQTTWDALKAVP